MSKIQLKERGKSKSEGAQWVEMRYAAVALRTAIGEEKGRYEVETGKGASCMMKYETSDLKPRRVQCTAALVRHDSSGPSPVDGA